MTQLYGWIPPSERNALQHANHERAMAAMVPFPGSMLYREEKAKVCLYEAGRQVMGGKDLPYNWQQTGSCVGAAGGSMAKTLMAVEIAMGELEEYRELWWPFTYGRSRFRCGMTRPGEGSLGSAYAEAAVKDGYVAVADHPGLPSFEVVDNWLKVSERVEYSWSDGDAQQSLDLLAPARLHLIGQASQLRNSAEWKASIQNGYPVTLASNFGTRGIRARGNPPVNIGEWNDNWPHQMYSDSAWDHPTEGLLFRIGNNWFRDAHPAPTQGEPPGGFWITAATADRICRDEVFGFSGLNGWMSRQIPWVF